MILEVPFGSDGPWSRCGNSAIMYLNYRVGLTTSSRTASGSFGAKKDVPYVTEKIDFRWRQC